MKHQKWLDSPLGEITRRQHYQGLAKQGIESPQPPEFPKGFEYVYGWFIEVFTGERITWQELKAWSEIKGIELRAWEAKTIIRLSLIYHG